MKRFVAETFEPAPDPEPKVTALFRRMLKDGARGEMREAITPRNSGRRFPASKSKFKPK